LLRFLWASQDIMSSAASNYDLRYLFLGICIAGLAVLLLLPASYEVLRRYQQPGLFLVASVCGYGAMMFATSYVEEEQQFWYWSFTGWAFYLHVRTCQFRRDSSPAKSHELSHSLLRICGAAALTVSHRILRRWNQTGQKFAAEPDIARTYFPNHQGTLWALVMMAYADIYLSLTHKSSVSSFLWCLTCLAVTVVAFTYKLAFAATESPELITEFVPSHIATALKGVPLILYARLVMFGILMLWAVGAKFRRKRGMHSSSLWRRCNRHTDL
jgi:ethanolaminephosphotransferase